MSKRSIILGTGSYLPERVVTNDELAERIETSHDWIVTRTGIRQRHIAADSEMTSDMAFAAAKAALEVAGVMATDVDMLLVATTTPDQTFPATATKVQGKLGMINGAAFDIQAVCSGFIYGLAVADSFIKSGQAETIVLIGAETFSRLLDWEDRGTCVLFGDGAGAIVLSVSENNGDPNQFRAPGNNLGRGVLSTHIHSNGDTNDLLYVDGGPSSTKTVGQVRMNGREVFRYAVNNLTNIVHETLEFNNLVVDDIDWLVPHQANKRILDSTARKLGLPQNKVIVTLDRHANTSAASIPLALDEAVRDGRVKIGDLVLLEAMGGGLTWGASLVRW